MARENFNMKHAQVKRHNEIILQNEIILSTEHKQRNGHNNSKHIKQDNVIA